MVHTFTALGCNIAVDVNSGAVHVLDRLSYDLLNLLDGPVGEGRGVPPELLEKPWYVEADMTKFLAAIIDCINHDVSTGQVNDPTKPIHDLLEQIEQEDY